MNTKFRDQIETYKHYWDIFSASRTEPPNILEAEKYLEKYAISNASYEEDWKELHNSVFDLSKRLPDMIFKKKFTFISLLGGGMFSEKDFEQFKTCLRELGESSFVIIQDTLALEQEGKIAHALNMHYPVDISWDEIMSGSFISIAVIDSYLDDYYLFGTSGEWGMYVTNTYIDTDVDPAGSPIQILGFNPKHREIFRTSFKIPNDQYCENLDYIPEEERPDLKEWVPKIYRK